jgi:hypothetical protein
MSTETSSLFENPKFVRSLVFALYGFCVALAAIGAYLEMSGKLHWHFSFEGWPLFYGLFGFAGYTFIVFTAKGLRGILKREEDYYDV